MQYRSTLFFSAIPGTGDSTPYYNPFNSPSNHWVGQVRTGISLETRVFLSFLPATSLLSSMILLGGCSVIDILGGVYIEEVENQRELYNHRDQDLMKVNLQ